MNLRPVEIGKRMLVSAAVALMLPAAHWCMAQDPPGDQPNPFAKKEDQDRPEPVPEFKLEKTLPTIPVPRDRRQFNLEMVNASLHHRDKQGIWVLDFSFKPLRIVTVSIPGKGRRYIHYLYYKVVNRAETPRMFVPQFYLVNEKGQKFEDNVVPQAIPVIRAREDESIPVLGAVDVVGMIPPSRKANVDDAVYGVAVWEKWDYKADRYSIYVRGLSDGYRETPAQSGAKPVVKYKTLRIDVIRRGDEHNISEKEIELGQPPYEWVYW
jgi:hypothetical protein